MKRNNLTTAVVAGIAGLAGIASVANAVELNADGLGQVLIYPYYTVNAGNTTLISVVNTTAVPKAVKVRFLEGYNSAEVLDFNLFLSQYDVWTASIFTLGDAEGGNLLTDDESCTIPQIKGGTSSSLGTLPDGRKYARFKASAYLPDPGPDAITRTREGHAELIEMATLAPGAIATAITHEDGVPPGCGAGLSSLVNANLDELRSPTGGLFGSGSIVNPAIGTIAGYNADAIDGFYTTTDPLQHIYSQPTDVTPNLASARSVEAVAGVARSYNFVSTAAGTGQLIVSDFVAPIDAVSSIFTASAIHNEYVLEAAAGAESEWVITFPTKRFYVNTGAPTAAAIRPFVENFRAPGRSCVAIGVSYFNREEQTVQSVDEFSPPDEVPGTNLCFESQVLSFQRSADFTANGNKSKILGSSLTANIDPRSSGFESGWLNIDLDPETGSTIERHMLRESNPIAPAVEGNTFLGLPVTGFLAVNYINANNGATGILSNYAALYRHRATRTCVLNDGNTPGACS
ncbi:hypothetical protein [Tahibacter amnicola]|uniref:Secreted protein n=1 Tax=Tahibacter amnicola TaxID=2976241 RepID=A0ABY6BHC9_9GAMM|nr:hypothetical protein [Tahibacter amnicola]UXI67780.1 hypothetical protein N4264_24105 [Tahibacter amnicola]